MVEGHQHEEHPDTGSELVDNVRTGGEQSRQGAAEEVEEEGGCDGEEHRVQDGQLHVAPDF